MSDCELKNSKPCIRACRAPLQLSRFVTSALAACALLVAASANAQSLPQAALDVPAKWTATWISHPAAPLREPLTLHFRRSFSVAPDTRHFVIHVSADNRFILYLNGERIGDGPARGDLDHWRYETFDLGPKLKPAGTQSQRRSGTLASTHRSPRSPTASPFWCRVIQTPKQK